MADAAATETTGTTTASDGGAKAATAAPDTTILGGGEQGSKDGGEKPAGNTEGTKENEGTTEGKEGETGGKTGEAKAQESGSTPFEPKLPEGVTVDKELLAPFQALVKDTKLPGDTAQKVFDLHLQAQERAQQQQLERWGEEQRGWVTKVKEDPEIGGANFKETLAVVERTMKKYGNPDLFKLLNESGLGNNPDLVKFIHRIGKADAEDRVAGTSSQQGGAKRTEADVIAARYPSMQQA